MVMRDVAHVECRSRDLHRAGRHRGRGIADAAGVALTTRGAGEGLRQSAYVSPDAALCSGSISDLAENGLVR